MIKDKSQTILATIYKENAKSMIKRKKWGLLVPDELEELKYRKLTPIECERLQTMPDNYTAMGNYDGVIKEVSNTQRYKAIGNSWTVDVIAHIFTSLSEMLTNEKKKA